MSAVKGQPSKRSKQYWVNNGYTLEQATFEANKRMPGTYEYYRYFKELSHEESEQRVSEFAANRKVTLENMIKRYGEIEGIKRWDSYRNKQAKSNLFEYKKEKFGWSEDDFNDYNKSRAVTLENLTKKHGTEQGTLMFNAYCERQAYAGCKLEYFIEKYGLEEGTNKYNQIGKLKSHCFDSYVLRHGNEVDAKIAFDDYWTTKSVNRNSFSLIANELFDELYKRLIANGFSEIYYTNNIGEWTLYDKNSKRIYFYDFFVKELGKIIEFNGDYWHANPTIYAAEQMINFPNKTVKKASDVWEYDRLKLETLKQYPLVNDYFIVWESDYRNNKQYIIEQCINFLMK